MANLTNCMQSGLKHNLSQCLLLVSTSSIPVDHLLSLPSDQRCIGTNSCGQLNWVNWLFFYEIVWPVCANSYILKCTKKNFFFFFFNKRIVPNKAHIGRHFSVIKYAYRDVY